MQEDEVVFEVQDRNGRSVRLRRLVYERHLPDRPEMADYAQEAAETVADPDWRARVGLTALRLPGQELRFAPRDADGLLRRQAAGASLE